MFTKHDLDKLEKFDVIVVKNLRNNKLNKFIVMRKIKEEDKIYVIDETLNILFAHHVLQNDANYQVVKVYRNNKLVTDYTNLFSQQYIEGAEVIYSIEDSDNKNVNYNFDILDENHKVLIESLFNIMISKGMDKFVIRDGCIHFLSCDNYTGYILVDLYDYFTKIFTKHVVYNIKDVLKYHSLWLVDKNV